MRKLFIGLAVLAMVGAACAKSTLATSPTTSSPTGSATPADAMSCAQNATLYKAGTLTIGTDNPAYPPYFGGTPPKGSIWQVGYPASGQGFESAVAYAVATKMGFTSSQVKWTSIPFNNSYAPGPKKFDVYLAQVSYNVKRAQAVDFSDSYYDVNQALIAIKGTPIASATTITQLKGYTLAAPLGTTSYDYITNVIQPTKQPGVYSSLAKTVAALNAHQVDGIVVDLPTSLYIADPYVQEVKHSTVVGQFTNPTGTTPEHFGIVLAKGSSLTSCVDLALASMKGDGTLQNITQTWLSEKTNVGKVPVFGP